MYWINMLGYVAVGVIFVASFWMILWCQYEDGIVGKIFIGMMALATLVTLGELIEGVDIVFKARDTMLLMGIAGFLTRHLYRTWKYVRPMAKAEQ